MPVMSMTGFASQEIVIDAKSWIWELKTVNGRGLEIKIRLPDTVDNLDAALRERLKSKLRRGSVQLSLRRSTTGQEGGGLTSRELDAVFAQVSQVRAAASRAGVTLAPLSVGDILEGRVLTRAVASARTKDADTLGEHLMPGFDAALDALLGARESEGRALYRIISGVLNRIGFLVTEARRIEKARTAARRETVIAAMEKVMSSQSEVDEARLEQELALIAVKSDVTEELDRLDAHVTTARGYLSEDAAMGRRLDFLTQELNREANTLCSKAQFADLTRVGLDLKAAIDQLREQSLNVE
ncbi:MAG: YicC/YloC family endoribonuclease [Pseudomonadota bacterium]